MKNSLRILAVVLFSIVIFACNSKTNAQQTQSSTGEQAPQVYGIKSGYYKSELPMSNSVAETWFDDYGNLQYVEIKTLGDPIKSYKLVRNGEEYYYSDYNKMGIKQKVDYIDYRKWEQPSASDLKMMNMKQLPTQMIFDKACKTYYVQDDISTVMSFWKGILMLKVLDDGTVVSEVMDLRETAVPSNIFDIPQDFKFEEELEQTAITE